MKPPAEEWNHVIDQRPVANQVIIMHLNIGDQIMSFLNFLTPDYFGQFFQIPNVTINTKPYKMKLSTISFSLNIQFCPSYSSYVKNFLTKSIEVTLKLEISSRNCNSSFVLAGCFKISKLSRFVISCNMKYKLQTLPIPRFIQDISIRGRKRLSNTSNPIKREMLEPQ